MEVDELRLVLTVTDFDRAVAFYRDALGLPQEADWSSDEGRVVLLNAGRATLEINDEHHAEAIDAIEVGRRVAGRIRVAFRVRDSSAKSVELATAGGVLFGPAVLTPWGDSNVRLDSPDGIHITLFSASDAGDA